MDILISILLDGLFAAIAAIGFGAVSDPSMRTFPFIAAMAAVGHALRFVLMKWAGIDIVTGSLAASFTIGMFSILFGRMSKTPTACLCIPALLPMVPGMYAYKSVFALIMFIQAVDDPVVSSDYLIQFASNFAITVMVICVLAGGATLPTFLFKRMSVTMTRATRKNDKAEVIE